MFKLHKISNTTETDIIPVHRNIFSQQRAFYGDKMFSQGYYQDFIGRSLCYFQQHSPVFRFRQASTGQELSHFHHNIHANGRFQDNMASYFPFEAPVIGGKRIMFDAFNSKFNINDSKHITLSDLSTNTGKKIIMSPSEFSSGSSTESLVTSSTTSSTETKKSFSCPQCKYSTDRKNNLKRHVITMHFDCDRKLECCGTIFRSKAKLREHVTLFHKNGYRCLVCARMFCRKALLRRHMAVHSGKKDFHCEFCTYATSHKSNLERHQKVHAKTTRLVYSPKTSLLFDRRFSTIDCTTEIELDKTSNQDDTVEETRRGNNGNALLNVDESELLQDDDYIDVSDNNNECMNEGGDMLSCIHHDQVKDYQFFTLNALERGASLSRKVDIENIAGTYTGELQTEMLSLKSTKNTFGNTRQEHSDNSDPVDNMADSAVLLGVTSPGKDKETSVTDEKENLDFVQLKKNEPSADRANSEKHKRLPRLYGLPYRCANCGVRFESQERFNKHDCEFGGTGIREQAEKSVSLVALILKQGKTCNKKGAVSDI